MINILLVIASLGVMLISELIPNRKVKETYETEIGPWKNVVIASVVTGLLSGLLSALFVSMKSYEPYWLLPMSSTAMGYAVAQTYMTDQKLLLIDRHMLRIGIVFVGLLILIANLTNSVLFQPLIGFMYLFALLTFLFTDMGASDSRIIAMFTPISTMWTGQYTFFLLFGILAVGYGVQRYTFKKHQRVAKWPAGLLFSIPYWVVNIIYPLLIGVL